jgi:hypothetical protein
MGAILIVMKLAESSILMQETVRLDLSCCSIARRMWLDGRHWSGQQWGMPRTRSRWKRNRDVIQGAQRMITAQEATQMPKMG